MLHNIDWDRLEMIRASLPNGEVGAWVREQARMLRVSQSTIYRALKKERGCVTVSRSGRGRRVTAEYIEKVCYFKRLDATNKMKGKRTGRELSTMEAMKMVADYFPEIAEPVGTVSVSTVNSAIRRTGFRVPKPIIRVEASYAGQEYQMDFSRSKYFQVVAPSSQGEDWKLIVSGKTANYKTGEDHKLRLWVVQIKDSYSRIQAFCAFAATSESAELGMYFLDWALRLLPETHMMQYLPERIKVDNGAFGKASVSTGMMDTLGIEIKRSEAGNSDSNGKVESGFSGLWQQFESPLSTRLTHEQGARAEMTLSEYNRRLVDHTVSLHDAPHPVIHGLTRGAAYQQSILRHPLKKLDMDLMHITCQTWTRKIGPDFVVRINGSRFEVPFNIDAAGKWGRFYRTADGRFAGEIINGFSKPFKLTPFTARDLDNFESRHAATYEQTIDNLANAHLEDKRKAKITARAAAKVAAKLRPKTETVTPKTVVDVAEEIHDRLMSVKQAKVVINGAMIDLGVPKPQREKAWDIVASELSEYTPLSKVNVLAKAVVDVHKKAV